jgi:sterol desaturase/sphingolipid hydroxylase (fatty acid hydroxylase superfamily)
MIVVLVAIVSLIVSNFLGYWIHRALHQKWSGPFYRAHMQHHLELYPPRSLASDKYREAHWYNRGFSLFTLPFLFIVLVATCIAHMLQVPLWVVLVTSIVFVGFGFLNDWIHDSFHLHKHTLQKFKYYRRMRIAHFIHHVDMSKNYGIVSIEWDYVFRTTGIKRIW